MKNQKWTNFSKKAFRFLKYFIISGVIIVLLEVAFGYWLISSRWSIFLTDAQMVSLSSEINATEPLPKNFIEMHEQLFPNAIYTSMTKQLFVNYGTRILFRKRHIENLPHCPCDLVYDIQVKNSKLLADVHWPGRLQELEYGFAVEDFSAPEKCFDYVIRHKLRNLQTTLPEYYQFLSKDISTMNDDELIELIILIRQNGFHRYKNPARFEEEFQKLKNKIGQ